MSTSSRRNIVIRIVATLSGDIATGVALASACGWLIQTAALGLFLSFLAWLLAFVASLAISQYLLHPVLHVVLSDRKLDHAIRGVQSLGRRAQALLSPGVATAH